jgi:hypothetical protein
VENVPKEVWINNPNPKENNKSDQKKNYDCDHALKNPISKTTVNCS